MDDAFIGSIDIAQKKAKTARYFNMSTRDLGKASQPGGELYGIEVTNDGLVIFPAECCWWIKTVLSSAASA